MRMWLVLWVLIGFVGCGLFGSSPASVVERFFKLVEAGKLSEATELLSKDAKSLLSFGGEHQVLRSFSDEIKRNGGIKSFKVVQNDIRGELAQISYELTFGNGQVKKDSEKLVKEEGKWKIEASK